MKEDSLYLSDIKEAISRILLYSEKGKTTFLSDTLIQDGVLRNFQVIGEAARRVSDDYKSNHTDIPWSDMIAMRNVVIHDYAELDFETLWDTIMQNLPQVLKQIDETA